MPRSSRPKPHSWPAPTWKGFHAPKEKYLLHVRPFYATSSERMATLWRFPKFEASKKSKNLDHNLNRCGGPATLSTLNNRLFFTTHMSDAFVSHSFRFFLLRFVFSSVSVCFFSSFLYSQL
jgi:hypothetical protein